VVIPPRAPPPDAAAPPTLVGGLVAPRGSVQLGWGRVLPLRTAASGSAAPVEVTWHLRSVEQIAGRERRPWPEHCPTGGFRARRAVDLGDRATGEQVLLAHPYLGADGDAALVLLDVALRAGSSYASFTAYLRFERVGNDIAVTVADAPAIDAPAASGPEVAGGAGEDDLVLALPDVIATGERLQVRISHPSSEVLDCTWTATAGSFPLGGSGTCVVYEAPAVRGDVIISAGAVVAGGRPALVHRVVRVRKHPVLLVPDLLGTSLEVDGAVVWPPVAGDALTAPAGALRCHADDHVRAQAVLDSASVHGVDVLGGIRRALDRAGHDTFGTPYDWRQAPSAGAHALDAQVRGVLGASEFDRVALVTHGYGGLVARDWLAHLGGEGRADEIVFVATPHRGMPIAYRWLHGGRFAVPTGNPLADLVDAFVAADGAATVASWPALHHLVPPEWNATRPGAADRAADVVAEAEHFHATLPDALPPGLRAVNVYNADQPTEHGYPTGAGSPESETDVTRGDGDGLVPAASARAVGTSLTFAVEMEVSACTHEALAGDGRTADLVVYRLERLT
jgi:triacylglycerol lipase